MMEVPRADPERGAPHGHGRSCKLTLLVALQNVLLTACLLGTLYVYWTKAPEPAPAPMPDPLEDVHILFFTIADILRNTTLEFNEIAHNNRMNRSDDKRRILVQCTGPYVLHMFVCYKSTEGQSRGTLQLEVEGSEDPLSTFTMNTNREVCRGLQNTTYLQKDDQASLRLYSTEYFRIKNITVGFQYLLGSRCNY